MTTAIVIDDDNDTASVLSEFLQLKGIEVIGTGHDGMDAFELYKKFKPDVVFLDVVMDRYDGFYALEKIKSNDQDAVVIMITAYLTKDSEKRLKKLHVSDIIYKPYDIDQIIHLVHKLVFQRFKKLSDQDESD